MSNIFILYPPTNGIPLVKVTNKVVLTENSFGNELAKDVFSREDIPPYDVALRDGWAINSGETTHSLCLESVHNGENPKTHRPGSRRWINTGGFLPDGADAVVQASDPASSDFGQDVYANENVLPRGTEWSSGSLILKAGTVLGAAEQALLFEAGISELTVLSKPSVAILATGHEISEVGAASRGARHASNSVYLLNLLHGLGLTDVAIFYSKDDEASISDRLSVLGTVYDFIITIGGTGQGQSDKLRGAITHAKGVFAEDKTHLSSSLPFVLAQVGPSTLFGLPGNPLGFINIVQRVVLPHLWGCFRTEPFPFRRERVYTGFDYEGRPGDICVQLARFEGKLIALPVQKGSGRSAAFRDAMAVIPNPNGASFEAGSCLQAELFFNGLIC